MSYCVLTQPIQTLDGIVILPTGTELTREVLQDVRMSRSLPPVQSHKILDFGSVKKDMNEFLSVPPYDAIFSDTARLEAVLAYMNDIKVISPVLDALEYYQTNDEYTYRHMLLVFALSIMLGLELIDDRSSFEASASAAPAHDFGKICVPLDILKKADALTAEQKGRIEQHTVAGHVLLQYYTQDAEALCSFVARDHHERIDGSGYPFGNRLSNLSVEIVAVADIYDALISQRPYRPVSYDNRTAMEEITAKAERGEFHWNVVKALVACNRKSRPRIDDCHISGKKRGTPPAGNNYGRISPG